ncbi:GNAT family N-acetyltransferase [Pseudonocardia sp. CNS-139]|nr:GNAT family N-acetyltransferase [Pseudonocardia sp. CNS-139]
MADHPLDNSVRSALLGAHAPLARTRGRAARYRTDVSPFAALPLDATEDDWADLAALVGPDEEIALTTVAPRPVPASWRQTFALPGVQMDGSGLDVAPDPEAVVLGEADVPEMLDLVARTRPGPFRTHTRLMGTYLGIRRDGALVAMAGERLRPPGWTEISAVCTDPAFRGQGLATRLVRAVGAVIRDRGDVPFLHAAADNTGAIRLYEQIGFTLRARPHFTALRFTGPEAPVPGADRDRERTPAAPGPVG